MSHSADESPSDNGGAFHFVLHSHEAAAPRTPELSIVIPCLNEAETVEVCINKARRALERMGVDGEIVVADNGSTDGSREVAQRSGARVIEVHERGYGAALRAGIESAKGKFVVIGDADDSYDFTRLDPFLERLRQGYDLVMGNRFRGGIEAGAMPLLHRYLGNPVLSFLGRLFFRTSIGDFHCGLRGFSRAAILDLGLTTSGMEYASEMVARAALSQLKITEVPTTLSPDGRSRSGHLRTWRDGWRHLVFLLTLSPRWLFLYPGLGLLTLGLLMQAVLAHGGIDLGSVGLGIHTMLYAGTASVVGLQLVWFAIFARIFGTVAGLFPKHRSIDQVLRVLTLERGLLIGLVLLVGGVSIAAGALMAWANGGYGPVDPAVMMRRTIPSGTMILMGMEFIVASFFLKLLQFRPEHTVNGQHRPATDRSRQADR